MNEKWRHNQAYERWVFLRINDPIFGNLLMVYTFIIISRKEKPILWSRQTPFSWILDRSWMNLKILVKNHWLKDETIKENTLTSLSGFLFLGVTSKRKRETTRRWQRQLFGNQGFMSLRPLVEHQETPVEKSLIQRMLRWPKKWSM
jgi:hypothetical protein